MTSPVNGLLTTYGSLSQVELNYLFTAAALGVTNLEPTTNYVFIGKVDQWPDDNNPPTPSQDQATLKKLFKNMIAAKLIYTSNLAAVVPRFDWTTGTVYSQYTDYQDIFTFDSNGVMNNKFYVRNNIDQVFKCLWNNNGNASTVEPHFEPGTFNSNLIFQGADNYKWKYMYTIAACPKKTFMDATWIPVPVGENTPNPLQTAAGFGDIEVINVTNGGSGYDPANAAITVTITGDGTGATGVATTNAQGSITDVVVTNSGTDYTYATVSISASIGSGATAITEASPIGGHG